MRVGGWDSGRGVNALRSVHAFVLTCSDVVLDWMVAWQVSGASRASFSFSSSLF